VKWLFLFGVVALAWVLWESRQQLRARAAVLDILGAGPLRGLMIIDRLGERGLGRNFGRAYSVLDGLTRQGLIRRVVLGASERSAVYELTPIGRAVAGHKPAEVDFYAAGLPDDGTGR
jgi:DNA-binding PadR family transcriptional regulator